MQRIPRGNPLTKIIPGGRMQLLMDCHPRKNIRQGRPPEGRRHKEQVRVTSLPDRQGVRRSGSPKLAPPGGSQYSFGALCDSLIIMAPRGINNRRACSLCFLPVRSSSERRSEGHSAHSPLVRGLTERRVVVSLGEPHLSSAHPRDRGAMRPKGCNSFLRS